MAYSDFTLRDIENQFQIAIVESPDLHQDVPEIPIQPVLQAILEEYTPLALAIHTEKARSEMLIAPVLIEVRRLLNHEVSLFSGIDFTVDRAQGLNGVCDFILSRSRQQLYLKAPVGAVVEAKNDNLKSGIPQCIAAMLGVRLFNESEGRPVNRVFGVVTTGTAWQFLHLEDHTVTIDQREYYLPQVAKLLGILVHLLRG